MNWRLRLRIILALLAVTALGLATKFYPGPGAWWINDWGPASVAYEIVFMLLVFLIVPRRAAITPIAVGVCATTCVLEVFQLWRLPWLVAVREETFLGRMLLGTSFSWWDLPTYPIGCILGWFLLHGLLRRSAR